MLHSLTPTLVRHGESTDNIIPIWAGHSDATLTNHGHAQAQ
jgi:broad specificity phosphatase PhoE